jgi:hypothetical protein
MSIIEASIYFFAGMAYFVPFYIAYYRKINGQKLIFWFNLIFAWTLVAWFLLIIAALSISNKK